MIFVQKYPKDVKGRTVMPSSGWFSLAADRTKRAKADKKRHIFDDTVYGHAEVRAALTEGFHRKCAYCESPLPDFGWPVEHFRPKGAVTGTRHPGYYWLAYDWENLYPACVACNSVRRPPPMWRVGGRKLAAGKGCQFPLEEGWEHTRAMSPSDDLDAERTLLLDPCVDDPELYIKYDLTGKADPIDADVFGEITIRVFNLNRIWLRTRRRKLILRLVKMLVFIKKLRKKGLVGEAKRLRDLTKQQFAADDCSWAAAARIVLAEPGSFGI